MKIAIASLLTLTAAVCAVPALTLGSDEEKGGNTQFARRDSDALYALVQQARADLRELRVAAGIHAHAAGPHIDPEGHHEGESAADRKREGAERDGHEDGGRESHEGGREGGHEAGGERGHREGREGGETGEGHEGRERGEHGGRESREGRGEEDGNRMAKAQKHAKTYRNGAHLILQYNPATQAFVGSVKNTTKTTLSQVRVEIHLSNGRELGPTKRVDLKPGATIPVELSAIGQTFTHWVTHPEAGVEEGHGEGGEQSAAHEARERGEHGAGGGGEGGEGHAARERGEHGGGGEGREGSKGSDARPKAGNLKPVYNQLQLLRGEMNAFSKDLAASKKK